MHYMMLHCVCCVALCVFVHVVVCYKAGCMCCMCIMVYDCVVYIVIVYAVVCIVRCCTDMHYM